MTIQISCLMVIRLAMIYSRRLGSDVKKFSRFAAAGVYGLTVLSISFINGSKKNIVDEAKASGKTPADFPQITTDVFKSMDAGIHLSPEEILGRNAWILWSATDHINNPKTRGTTLGQTCPTPTSGP
jgi:hypothetical protein